MKKEKAVCYFFYCIIDNTLEQVGIISLFIIGNFEKPPTNSKHKVIK